MLGGAILPVWQLTELLIRERGATLTASERNLRVVSGESGEERGTEKQREHCERPSS